MKRFLRSIGIALLAILVPAAVFAQASGSALEGRVTDEQGGGVPGVTVTATNDSTGIQRVAVTDSTGAYRFPALPAGTYTVVVELPGFATVTTREVELRVAQVRSLDATLRQASVQESITITADAPLVANSPAIGTVVSQQELENLPLNGRQFANLASLAPGTSLGVNPDPTKPGQLVVSLNGGIGRNVNYLIDGGDNTDDTIGGALQNFNLEAVQEFTIQTQSYKAEFGRSTGGVLTVVTKTGTNEFDGSVYGFFRDKSLNSKTRSEEAAGRDKQDYERKQYGFSIGGPIVRDRAHFFGTYETTDRETMFIVNTQGIFPQLDGQAFANPFGDELITAKATWNLTASQMLQVRYGSQTYEDVYSASPTSTPDNLGILNSDYSSVLVGHNAQIGTSMLNEFIYQFTDFENGIMPVTDAPTLVFANGVNSGQNFNTPQTTIQEKHQFKDDFSFSSTLMGQRHDFKAGFNYVDVPTLGGSFSSGLGGRYTYGGNSQDAPIVRIEFNSGFSSFSTPGEQMSLYFQDDWQATPRLTLNLGIRYDLFDHYDFDQSNNAIWQLLRTQTTYNEGYLADFREGDGQVKTDDDNWGPRLGFTMDLTGNGEHIIRGGWGIYHDFPYTNATILFPSIAVQSNFGASYLHANSAGIRNADGSLYRVGQPLPANQLSNPGFPAPNDVASPTIAAPRAVQTSLGYSTQLSNWLGLTIDAVNIDYSDIPFRFRFNPIVPGTTSRRFPQFGNIRMWYGEGEASYTGLNLGLRGRLSQRFEMQGFYTWSEAEGNVLAGADEFRLNNNLHQPELAAVPDQSVNPLDPLCDACFGPMNTDATHRVTLSGLYSAPWGINLSGIYRYRSGLPYNEWSGRDLNGDGFAMDLPAGVDHVNSRRGDDFSQFDVRVGKEFGFGRGLGLELIAEMFNVFNEDNPYRFAGAREILVGGQAIPNPNFGRPSIFSGDPLQGEQRLIQLGARFRF